MSTAANSVVVGVDGTTTATNAACWAAALADTFDLPVHVVYAAPGVEQLAMDVAGAELRPDPGPLEWAESRSHQWAQSVLDRAEKAVRAERPNVSIHRALSSHGAAHTLQDLSQKARFLVLGADEVSPGSALLVGSTTVTVATHAECPVVAWRGTQTTLTDQPIVVGVDGSESGAVALATAFELAQQLGVDIHAVHTWSDRLPAGDVTVPYVIDWDEVESRHRQQLSDMLASWRERYPTVGVHTFVDRAKPAQALIRHARDTAQLIVVGNRGHNLLRSVLMGSTTLNLLHHSPLPVMVCR